MVVHFAGHSVNPSSLLRCPVQFLTSHKLSLSCGALCCSDDLHCYAHFLFVKSRGALVRVSRHVVHFKSGINKWFFKSGSELQCRKIPNPEFQKHQIPEPNPNPQALNPKPQTLNPKFPLRRWRIPTIQLRSERTRIATCPPFELEQAEPHRCEPSEEDGICCVGRATAQTGAQPLKIEFKQIRNFVIPSIIFF